MFPVDRRRRILEQVAEQQTIRIGELASELGVSEMTIRRDVSRLEQDGFLRHTYGGATAHITKSIELAFNARALENAPEKWLIGMRAAEDLAAAPVLYVGPGTTTEQFSLFLTRTAGQLVITGSLPVASLLGSRPAHVVAQRRVDASHAGLRVMPGPSRQSPEVAHRDKRLGDPEDPFQHTHRPDS